ncbi:hypothetical protein L3N51_01350 [Metallosphaera sp. J1]|uniref:hypothetical protein n=1 Tax=Metallosphaera javensis (ex Hofmann et al. 2022) TaxID=99938 RepID=UPI001EDD262F|nr:hypothetical protein [Metallosphaera javensis (ex Hofmann et al. 2022)]MCG3109060.1 hypothetical protein [Metallosphaera javensis (ex Hofmann et al. 2022)]
MWVYSVGMSGIFTLIVLGIGWQDFVSWLDLFYLSSIEIKLIFMIILYLGILGILEGTVVYAPAYLIMVEMIPFLVVLFARKIFRR